jgi:hypothetical protein
LVQGETDAGVVDEDVETAEVGFDLLYGGEDRFVFVLIEDNGANSAFDVFGLYFFELGFGFGGGAGAHDDVVVG